MIRWRMRRLFERLRPILMLCCPRFLLHALGLVLPACPWGTITARIDEWHCEARYRILCRARRWILPKPGVASIDWVRFYSPHPDPGHCPILMFDGHTIRFARYDPNMEGQWVDINPMT